METFVKMSGDVSRICDIGAHDLARIHVYQGHAQAAHPKGLGTHGALRLDPVSSSLLDRAWDLIIHGPAHRGFCSAAVPMDKDDQNDHFFFNHPERKGYFAA